MRGLPKLPWLKGISGRLGRSRDKGEAAGSWADFDVAADQWRSIQSPKAARTKAQRTALIQVWAMLAALPVALISCLVSVSASGGVSDLEASQERTDQAVDALIARRDEAPRMSGLAERLTEEWLAGSGRVLTSLEEARGAAVCGPPGRECETHTLLVELGEPGSGRRFAALVAIDPQSGSMPYPPTLQVAAYGAAAAPDLVEEASTETDLPEAAEGLLEQWRLAWGRRDQLRLLELAGEDAGIMPTLAEPWELVETAPMRQLWQVGDGSSWWVTVAVTVRDSCATTASDPDADPNDPASDGTPRQVCVAGPAREIAQVVSLAQSGEFLRVAGSGAPTVGAVGLVEEDGG